MELNFSSSSLIHKRFRENSPRVLKMPRVKIKWNPGNRHFPRHVRAVFLNAYKACRDLEGERRRDNIAVECANKRKMSVGSWPYWREVGKRGAIRDRLDIARFLSEFISEGKSFVDSLRSTVEPSREKERRGEKEKEKNNFETNFKFYDRVRDPVVARKALWRDKRRKLAEDLAIKAI